jgi:site-specific recombinase XerD
MDQAIAKFKDYLERRYPDRSTAKHYISDLLIFRQFAGPVKPPEITAKMVDEFVQAQSQQGLKPATLNRRLASLASFIDFLIDEAEADDWQNPVRWKRHRIKPGRHLPRDVSDETVRRLFAVLDDRRDRAIFSLMVSAGLRVGEVVRLQLADLPSVETTILSRLRVNGKGDKDRLTWLTQAALEPLQAWLAQRPPGNCQHLFLNQHGQPLSVAGVEYRLKQYCQQAQVQLTCHQLRHTFARRLAEQGMPIESLAKLLGHQSIQTTQLYIDGADPTVRQDFLRALEQASPAWPDEPTGTSAQGVPAAGPTRSERLDPVGQSHTLCKQNSR